MQCLLDVMCIVTAVVLGLMVPLCQLLFRRAETAHTMVQWLDKKSIVFHWLIFAVSWWVLQVRFCMQPRVYTLRDVLFLGDALLVGNRRRQHLC